VLIEGKQTDISLNRSILPEGSALSINVGYTNL